MHTSNQIALVLAMFLSSMGICLAHGTTCSSDECSLGWTGYDVTQSYSDNPSMSGLALLQVSQDLDHQHDKKTQHSHRHHPGTKKIREIANHKKKHQSTVDSQHVPAGFLSIRSEPHDDAAVSGALEKGSTFKVNSAHEDTDGKVWLRLSDGRGWVPRDQVSEIEASKNDKASKNHKAYVAHKDHKSHGDHIGQQMEVQQFAEIQQEPVTQPITSKDHKNHKYHTDHKDHKGHKNHRDYGHHGGHSSPISEIQQKPRSQEQIREEYKKIPMKEKGLPDHIEHEHGKTINADWRNEYPYKHDPKPKSVLWYGVAVQHHLSFAIGLSILAGLFA